MVRKTSSTRQETSSSIQRTTMAPSLTSSGTSRRTKSSTGRSIPTRRLQSTSLRASATSHSACPTATPTLPCSTPSSRTTTTKAAKEVAVPAQVSAASPASDLVEVLVASELPTDGSRSSRSSGRIMQGRQRRTRMMLTLSVASPQTAVTSRWARPRLSLSQRAATCDSLMSRRPRGNTLKTSRW